VRIGNTRHSYTTVVRIIASIGQSAIGVGLSRHGLLAYLPGISEHRGLIVNAEICCLSERDNVEMLVFLFVFLLQDILF